MQDDITTMPYDGGIIIYEQSDIDTEIRSDTVLSLEDMR